MCGARGGFVGRVLWDRLNTGFMGLLLESEVRLCLFPAGGSSCGLLSFFWGWLRESDNEVHPDFGNASWSVCK